MTGEEVAAAWRLAYARQSLSDFQTLDVLAAGHVDDCQRMHALQMAMEKAAKAHFWASGPTDASEPKVNRSHKVAEKYLPVVFRQRWSRTHRGRQIPGYLEASVKRLCNEVDRLAPAVTDDGQREDNCEYPWAVRDADRNVTRVNSPLDQEFTVASLQREYGTVLFLKAVRASVQEIVDASAA